MKRLTIGLGIAVIIFILLCTVACGGGDGPLARGGLNMIVVSGQATIQSGGGNTLVVEGQEAVTTAGDQIMAGEAGVKLLLVDGSLLDLKPDTDLQVVTFSSEGTAKLRSQLKGRIEVEAASPLLTLEISTSVIAPPWAMKTIQFTTIPAVRETAFGLWIDGLNARLAVEAGEVNVTDDDGTATISAGREAILDGKLVFVEPTATADLVPTITSDLVRPSPTATATPTVAPNYLYSPPGLQGPGDGDDFKSTDDILLMWDTPIPLAEDEWYEVQLWREGEVPYTVAQWTKEGTWKVEPKYYPGRYLWRIRIVRGQEGRREGDLSPLSQTRSFSWLSPPPVQTLTATTSSSDMDIDLTAYLRGTRTASGFAALSDDQVYGWEIYEEGQCVYGDVAVQIGEMTYHFVKAGVEEQLPDLWRVEFEFAEELKDHTTTAKGDRCAKGAPPGFNPKKAWFWVGILDGDSAVGEDNPYSLTMRLYEGNELRKSIQVFFTVADVTGPGGGREEVPDTPPTRESP